MNKLLERMDSDEDVSLQGIKTVQLRSEQEGNQVRLYYQVIPGVGASIGEACARGAGMDQDSLDRLIEERGF